MRLNVFGEILAQFTRFFFLKNRFVSWLAEGSVISLKDQQTGSIDHRVQSLSENLHPTKPEVAEESSAYNPNSSSIIISNQQQTQQNPLTTSSENNPVITTPFAMDVAETIPPQTRVLQDLNTKFRPLARFFTEQHLTLKKQGKEVVQKTFKNFFAK